MRTASVILALSSCLVAAAGVPRQAPLSQRAAADQAWFERTTQQLYDSLVVGGKAAWRRVLAEDCVYTTEDGVAQTKAQFLEDLKGLRKGFSGGIKVDDLTVRPLGTGAVVHYWLDEWEDVLGQKLHTRYVTTDAYRRVGGTWEMVGSQTTVVPRDLAAVPADSSRWSALIGEYRLSPEADLVYRVFERDGMLFGGPDEGSATRLIPLSPLVYFQQGSIHTIIFVANAAGVVSELREVHKYNEVRWTRVSPR